MADSSVKYKKFSVFEDGNKRKVTVSAYKRIAFVFVATVLVATAIIAVVIGVGVGISAPNGQAEDIVGLRAYNVSRQDLQGEYIGSTGSIQFQVTETISFVNITVTSNGKSVVIILHSVESSMTMMGVRDTEFLVMENQPGQEKYVEYIIPKNQSKVMEDIMEGKDRMSDEVLEKLDNKNVNETRWSSLQKLVLSTEALLIIDAAKALGERGYKGTDYPAALRFYLLALRLLYAQDSTETDSHTTEDDAMMEPKQKRAIQCSQDKGGDVCSRCPFRQGTNNCFGLCGRGCSCWSFVCGDCCVHEYCLTHDQCCADHGFFSYPCLAVAWRVIFSSCSHVYECN